MNLKGVAANAAEVPRKLTEEVKPLVPLMSNHKARHLQLANDCGDGCTFETCEGTTDFMGINSMYVSLFAGILKIGAQIRPNVYFGGSAACGGKIYVFIYNYLGVQVHQQILGDFCSTVAHCPLYTGIEYDLFWQGHVSAPPGDYSAKVSSL